MIFDFGLFNNQCQFKMTSINNNESNKQGLDGNRPRARVPTIRRKSICKLFIPHPCVRETRYDFVLARNEYKRERLSHTGAMV